MLQLPSKEILLKQVSPKFDKRGNKLVSVLASFMPATRTRKEIVETAEAVSINSDKNKGDHSEYFT